MYIAALMIGLFVVMFALGAARLGADADRQSDQIRRRFSGRPLPDRS